MPNDCLIRRMTIDDVPTVAAIEAATFPTPWSEDAFRKEITDNPVARYLVAEKDGAVIGFAGAWIILDESHITNIAVLVEHRGQGYGRALTAGLAGLAVAWPPLCPAALEPGHTVLGRMPAFALGVWFGTLLKKNAFPSYRLYIGLAVCPLLWVDEVPRLAVLLVLASVLFWAVYAAGQHVPAPLCPALRRLAGWCYGVYLVHHVLLTLVFLPFVQGHGLPLAGMFPVYLAASFVPAAVLTAMSSPVSKAVKKLA